nr:immunoglobulin light chain junction region [Macaca mulatta]
CAACDDSLSGNIF